MEAKSKNKGAKRPSPMTFRATDEQKQEIRDKAGRMPVGAYIRFKVLDMPDTHRPVPDFADKELLERLLHRLGKSRLSSNLNQIARACNKGTLPLPPESKERLMKTCDAVEEMRCVLLEALGRKPPQKTARKSEKTPESKTPKGEKPGDQP